MIARSRHVFTLLFICRAQSGLTHPNVSLTSLLCLTNLGQGLGLDVMFVHDMVVTPHWYGVVMGPVRLNVRAFMSEYLVGKRALAELLIYNHDQPSKVGAVVWGGGGGSSRGGGLHIRLSSNALTFYSIDTNLAAW